MVLARSGGPLNDTAPRCRFKAMGDALPRCSKGETVTTLGDQAGVLEYEEIVNFVDQMIWSATPTGFHDYYNRRWYEFTGVPEGSTDGDAWNGMFHPDDQQRAWKAWHSALETGDPYAIEYRLRHRSGEYRWVLGRALCVRDEQGRIRRWYGSCTDIHEGRKTVELNAILSRELSHRIKNIFAVISSLIWLSGRSRPELAPFTQEIRARIGALARAHEFVRPHSEESRPQIGPTTLKGILTSLLEAYPIKETNSISITGDDIAVDDKGATAIALMFHELATNAVKYGALADSGGSIDIDVNGSAAQIDIIWRETGGPAIEGPPLTSGFGTRLTDISIQNQLGGQIRRDWKKEGLCVAVTVPSSSLVRVAHGERALQKQE